MDILGQSPTKQKIHEHAKRTDEESSYYHCVAPEDERLLFARVEISKRQPVCTAGSKGGYEEPKPESTS